MKYTALVKVYQLTQVEAPNEEAAIAAIKAQSGNLPVDVTIVDEIEAKE